MSTTKHRRHPLSLAISMSLFAAMVTSAMASPPTGAQVDASGTQATAPQDASTASSADADQAQRRSEKDKQAKKAVTLSTVNVVGVRASQMRAIELKRLAPNI